jgi:hypothetical protein
VTSRTQFGRAGFTGAGVVVLAFLLALNAPHAHAKSSGAKVVVSEYRYDFGDVFAGQFMNHVFTIRNEGTVPLTLSDVVPATLKSSWDSPAVRPAIHGQVNFSSHFLASDAAIKGPRMLPAPMAARLNSSRSLEPVPT